MSEVPLKGPAVGLVPDASERCVYSFAINPVTRNVHGKCPPPDRLRWEQPAPRVRRCTRVRARRHPGGNQGATLKSISHRCYLCEVAFVWELPKETVVLPLGCLQGGGRAGGGTSVAVATGTCVSSFPFHSPGFFAVSTSPLDSVSRSPFSFVCSSHASVRCCATRNGPGPGPHHPGSHDAPDLRTGRENRCAGVDWVVGSRSWTETPPPFGSRWAPSPGGAGCAGVRGASRGVPVRPKCKKSATCHAAFGESKVRKEGPHR